MAQPLRPDFSDVRGRRLLIALSGGADSVALAVMLAEARKAYDLTLYAAHVDHGIRPESQEDARFCRSLCQRLGIPFESVRFDVPAEAKKQHRGLEAVGRELRYHWLREVQNRTRSDFIVLAHHMDDQAETVLMHLGRGAGPEGVCGMRRLSKGLYRPMLDYRKSELVAWLVERGFEWREDSTNQIADNPRNILRLHGIPALEQCYPQFVRATARFAQSSQIESDFIGVLTREYLTKTHGGNEFCTWLELSELPHRAIMRRAIREVCSMKGLSWEQLNALESLCHEKRGKIDLSGELMAERTGNRLYFIPKKSKAIVPVSLSLDGETACKPLCTITAAPCLPNPVKTDQSRQVLKAATLRGAVIRTRRAGDRIRPLGCGDRLLSDYLTDKKVDRPLRDFIPLVAVGNRIHWVCGYGISQEAAVSPGDEAVTLKYNEYNGGKHHAE